jgi:predicted Fe-Mo cluster-binding NifX family protein
MACARLWMKVDIPKHMKTAFSSWNNRIAPVFDVARQVFLVESDAGLIIRETEEAMPPGDLGVKARHLAELGVNTLVCGAISLPLQGLVATYSITVVPFVAGDLREVIQACLEGRIHDEIFAMPGCCRQTRRRGGSGMGEREGHGQCVMGDALEAGSCGICICPNCSHHEPHERGVPCSRKKCPICGSALIRG